MNAQDVSGTIGIIEAISAFLLAPPVSFVIACAWILAPLMAFVGVQRVKKYAALSAAMTQLIAVAFSFALALVLMIGLYVVPVRHAVIHAGLIAWCYPAAIKWLMEWAQQNRPMLYDALRSGASVSKDVGVKPDPNETTYY